MREAETPQVTVLLTRAQLRWLIEALETRLQGHQQTLSDAIRHRDEAEIHLRRATDDLAAAQTEMTTLASVLETLRQER